MKKIEAYLEKKFKIDAPYYIRGTFWNTASQIIVLIGGLVTTIIFAKLLTTTDYGNYKYIISIAALFSTLSLYGLGQSILQATAQKHYAFYTETIKISLLYGLGISITSFICSLYYFYQQNYLLAVGCILIAIIQPFTNTYQNIILFLQGSKRFRDTAKAQVFNMLTMSLVAIVTIFLTHNILVLLSVYFISNFLTFFLTHLYYGSNRHDSTPPEIYKKFISYAKHTSIRNFISSVAFRLDSILIFTRLGATELAIYTIANLFPEQIKGSLKNINVLLSGKFTTHENTNAMKRTVFIRSLQLFIFLSFLSVIYVLLAPFVYRLLFPNYENAIFLSQIAALSFPAMVYFIPFSTLQTQLNEKALHSFTAYSSIFQICTTFILIYFFGLIGAVTAKILSRYIGTVIIYYYLFFDKKSD